MTAPELDGIVWHTSSYSHGGSACIEVGWRTSSYSSNGGTCVEVGWRTSSYCDKCEACVEVAPTPEAVLIRDSKHRTGPALSIPTPAWHAFLTTLPH